MAIVIEKKHIFAAMERVIDRVLSMYDELNQLDAAMGDGDTGITVSKGAIVLREYLASNPKSDDLGSIFIEAGKAINKTASSTLGTLTATALFRAGREARGLTNLDSLVLAKMLIAADEGVQERGKAKPGDKTVVDALHPAAVAFAQAIKEGLEISRAARLMLEAAKEGRDNAVPLRSKIGRGAWVGERTENKLDPGTVLFVSILEGILDVEPEG